MSAVKSALKDETIKEDAAKVLLELGEQDGADFFRAFLQERFFRYGHAEVQTVNALLELVQ